MTLIIGFHGRAGAGKDTAADSVDDAIKLAFVKPLKDAAKILFNFTDEQLYDNKLKEVIDKKWNNSPREILQWLGTDVLRNDISEDFFLIHMKQRIENVYDIYDIIIISDCRFPNEAEFIRNIGGVVIEITRDDANEGGTEHSEHISEQKLPRDLVDYVIENNGTKDELFKKVNDLINLLK